MSADVETIAPAVDLAIIGAGPCGLACAISAMRAGLSVQLFDQACVVSTITQYPWYVHFFSTAEKLSLGGIPFVVAEGKPSRRDGLAYYRAIVRHFGLPLRQYERVVAIEGSAGDFELATETRSGARYLTRASRVVVATGYFGSPNRLGVPGEDLPHVAYVYREGHEAFQRRAVVVGGGNSAAEAALDLWRSGADVTLVHFGPTFDKKIKPWILPDLQNRIAEGSIAARWMSRVVEIGPESITLRTEAEGDVTMAADHVYLLTGFAPNVTLLRDAGVSIDPLTGIPSHDPATLETDVPGIFIAGVVVAGYDANKVFIENGRFHGDKIVARVLGRPAPETPRISRDLDT